METRQAAFLDSWSFPEQRPVLIRARMTDLRFILVRRLHHNGREVISRDVICCRIHWFLLQF